MVLGESEKVGLVYAVIVEEGSITLEALSSKTGFEADVLRKCLERLTLLPLVTTDLDRKHKTVYRALPPKEAFEAIVTSVRWHAQKVLREEGGATEYPDDVKTYVQHTEEQCKRLAEIADSLYKDRSLVNFEMITVAHTKEEMIGYLCDSFGTAEKEIVGIVSPPFLLGPIVWVSVLSRMRKGVVYRRISIVDEILRHGLTISQREVEKFGVDLSLVDRSIVDQQFYVVDGYRVIFFNPSSTPGEFEFAGQVINNKDLASRYRREFNRLKNMSVPAQFVLKYLGNMRNSLLESAASVLDGWEVKWVESVIDFGAFSPLHLSQEQEEKALRDSISHGFLRRQGRSIVGNFKINFKEISTAWAKTKESVRK